MEPITVDFETEAIVGNPVVHPPRPCGVAVWVPDEDPVYLPCEDKGSEGHELLLHCWHERAVQPLLFHNAPFDLSVAERWLDLPWPRWDRVHDTMYLVFQEDPYGDLGLKPASERILGLPPEEQADLRDWILKNVPGATKKTWGAHISKAPFDLVEPYAIGDVVRTKGLYDALIGKFTDEKRI